MIKQITVILMLLIFFSCSEQKKYIVPINKDIFFRINQQPDELFLYLSEYSFLKVTFNFLISYDSTKILENYLRDKLTINSRFIRVMIEGNSLRRYNPPPPPKNFKERIEIGSDPNKFISGFTLVNIYYLIMEEENKIRLIGLNVTILIDTTFIEETKYLEILFDNDINSKLSNYYQPGKFGHHGFITFYNENNCQTFYHGFRPYGACKKYETVRNLYIKSLIWLNCFFEKNDLLYSLK